MQTLRAGMAGEDVEKWQFWLRGLNLYLGEVDGEFGPVTVAATKEFQRTNNLVADGIAGNRTLGVAMRQGFDAVTDDPALPDTLEWPPRPGFTPLTPSKRVELLGKFQFVASPTPGNPEGIEITDDWEAKNIETFTIPQLVGKLNAHKQGKARFHKLVGPKVQKLFERWESEGLLGHVLTYWGSYNSRFVRGSKIHLSNHSFGSAFDINAEWNGFGKVPALKGREGTVRELVVIANELGFYWGGHFAKRDGMHFELAVT
jgi:hypothetical protein